MKEQQTGPDRRGFLAAGLAGAGAALTAAVAHGADERKPIPRRRFGKTKEEVSALGLGGHTLGLAPTYEEAERILREGVEAGVTFLDNAWEYHKGRSEEWMGKALHGLRDKVFLMTKVCTHGRGVDVAMQQLDESLKRLKTDHLDLWQVHECVYDNDPDLHFAKGGVIEALDKAKKMGKTRYVGFTGHKHPRIHLAMLAHDYPFDAVQMPLNAFDATYRSFEKLVLPELIKRGIAPIGMKSLGGNGRPIQEGAVTVEEALRYAVSLPVAVTVSGIDSLAVLRQNLGIVGGMKAMTPEEMQALRKRLAPVAGDGRMELYKSTMRYDGDVGREQHGFPPGKELPL